MVNATFDRQFTVHETSGNQTSDLKSAGLKATAPRLKILELFQRRAEEGNERRHISAEDVYKELVSQGVDIGLATVYRVLSQFERAGLITRHHFEADRATYELDDGGQHDHLVCLSCGKVIEFVDPEIEKAQAAVARRYGFELSDHTMVLYGLCPECRSKHRR